MGSTAFRGEGGPFFQPLSPFSGPHGQFIPSPPIQRHQHQRQIIQPAYERSPTGPTPSPHPPPTNIRPAYATNPDSYCNQRNDSRWDRQPYRGGRPAPPVAPLNPPSGPQHRAPPGMPGAGFQTDLETELETNAAARARDRNRTMDWPYGGPGGHRGGRPFYDTYDPQDQGGPRTLNRADAPPRRDTRHPPNVPQQLMDIGLRQSGSDHPERGPVLAGGQGGGAGGVSMGQQHQWHEAGGHGIWRDGQQQREGDAAPYSYRGRQSPENFSNYFNQYNNYRHQQGAFNGFHGGGREGQWNLYRGGMTASQGARDTTSSQSPFPRYAVRIRPEGMNAFRAHMGAPHLQHGPRNDALPPPWLNAIAATQPHYLPADIYGAPSPAHHQYQPHSHPQQLPPQPGYGGYHPVTSYMMPREGVAYTIPGEGDASAAAGMNREFGHARGPHHRAGFAAAASRFVTQQTPEASSHQSSSGESLPPLPSRESRQQPSDGVGSAVRERHFELKTIESSSFKIGGYPRAEYGLFESSTVPRTRCPG
ncbi:unnamed protein product [Vitrella brassicaformis CCMP3155]|uniref:Uncharacterized protein n=1 Tax=Vitrella brassicaformis (strain CCMP3155) TaxID=1169540 RepID=A0A0G4FFA3_VITBC|nr:unnamed protein product [Vitrella brassicaformis CCMP3155]|eukprot:CEM11875.1 unnamed protein product [Vitrella brassicaformis CCMP3155]